MIPHSRSEAGKSDGDEHPMKAPSSTSWAILSLLLLANLGWAAWNWHDRLSIGSGSRRFKIVPVRNNGTEGISIKDVNTGQPIWAEWDLNHDGKPDAQAFYFQGQDVFNVNFEEQIPRYHVYFYGNGKSATWWQNRGGAGQFTDRIQYDTSGNLVTHEIWYRDAWCPVEKRSGTNYITSNGRLIRPELGTNGIWSADATTNAPLDR